MNGDHPPVNGCAADDASDHFLTYHDVCVLYSFLFPNAWPYDLCQSLSVFTPEDANTHRVVIKTKDMALSENKTLVLMSLNSKQYLLSFD